MVAEASRPDALRVVPPPAVVLPPTWNQHAFSPFEALGNIYYGRYRDNFWVETLAVFTGGATGMTGFSPTLIRADLWGKMADGSAVWRQTSSQLKAWDPENGTNFTLTAASGYSFTLPVFRQADGRVYVFAFQSSGASAGIVNFCSCYSDLTDFQIVSSITKTPSGSTRFASSTILDGAGAFFKAVSSGSANQFVRYFPYSGAAASTPSVLSWTDDFGLQGLPDFYGRSVCLDENARQISVVDGDQAPDLPWPDPLAEILWDPYFANSPTGTGIGACISLQGLLRAQIGSGQWNSGASGGTFGYTRGGIASPAPGQSAEAHFQPEAFPETGLIPFLLHVGI